MPQAVMTPVPMNQQTTSAPNTDHTAEFDPKDISDNKVIAMCPYLFSVFGVLIAQISSKDSPYVAFHVRQAIKIWICFILSIFMMYIPILGWIAAPVCVLILTVVLIISFFSVCSGKAKEVPIISGLKFLK